MDFLEEYEKQIHKIPLQRPAPLCVCVLQLLWHIVFQEMPGEVKLGGVVIEVHVLPFQRSSAEYIS